MQCACAPDILLAVGTVIIGITVLSPQTLLVPLFLFNSLTPLVLFVLSAVKYKNGLAHAKWICAGLAALMFGLSLSVLGFLFPVAIATTTSYLEPLSMRPLKLAYIVALFVGPICMMIALSAVVRSLGKRQETAVAEAVYLRSNLAQFENQTVAQQKSAQALIQALEALVQDDPESTLLPPAEKQIVDKATKAVLENIELVGFGARELVQILGASEKDSWSASENLGGIVTSSLHKIHSSDCCPRPHRAEATQHCCRSGLCNRVFQCQPFCQTVPAGVFRDAKRSIEGRKSQRIVPLIVCCQKGSLFSPSLQPSSTRQ